MRRRKVYIDMSLNLPSVAPGLEYKDVKVNFKRHTVIKDGKRS